MSSLGHGADARGSAETLQQLWAVEGVLGPRS